MDTDTLKLREKITAIEKLVDDPFINEKFTPAVREVMRLAVRGYTNFEMGEMIGKTESAVNALVMRGLAHLNLAKRTLPKYALEQIEKVLEG